MKTALLLVALSIGHMPAHGAAFREVRLASNGSNLVLSKSDGSQAAAPKLETQDSFGAPAISQDGRYAGWLAEFPDFGASYSQPLYLVVLDQSNRIARFSGKFGMVFGWCFGPTPGTVAYTYSFPHGQTPVGFEMRRIEDSSLLRQFEAPPEDPYSDLAQPVKHIPAWAKCTIRRADE